MNGHSHATEPQTPSLAYKSAAIGFGAWVLLAAASVSGYTGQGVIEVVIALAVLVIVPMGLVVHPTRSSLKRLTVWLQPVAGLLFVGALFLDRGTVACTLTVPWAVLTGLLALDSLTAIAKERPKRAAELAPLIAGLFVVVGAAWASASRLGLSPMGFEEPLVLLTAVHFHFTGFAAPLILGVAIRQQRGGALHSAALWGLLAGTPLLAAGFVLSDLLQYIAATLIAVSMLLAASIMLVRLTRFTEPRARVLIGLSSLSVMGGMGLALYYATGEIFGEVWISIADMALYHGLLNSVGFGLLGLFGVCLQRAAQ